MTAASPPFQAALLTPRARQRGFSVLETLVAAALLLVVMMAVLQIMPSASLASKHNDNQLAADSIAQGRLAALRTQPYDAIASSTDKVVLNGTEFNVEVSTAAPPSELGTSHVRQVTVTVKWNDPGPVVHPCKLQAQVYMGKTL